MNDSQATQIAHSLAQINIALQTIATNLANLNRTIQMKK